MDSAGGHVDGRTGEYHCHRAGCDDDAKRTKHGGGCSKRPSHSSTLDVGWVRRHGRIAPYTCRTFGSVNDVDIEHIVAWAEARRSGLQCADASAFANDPLNITVAYPNVNRHQKRDKDIANWQPTHNACWYAARVQAVKSKYGLSMDARERAAIEAVLSRCSASARANWRCD